MKLHHFSLIVLSFVLLSGLCIVIGQLTWPAPGENVVEVLASVMPDHPDPAKQAAWHMLRLGLARASLIGLGLVVMGILVFVGFWLHQLWLVGQIAKRLGKEEKWLERFDAGVKVNEPGLFHGNTLTFEFLCGRTERLVFHRTHNRDEVTLTFQSQAYCVRLENLRATGKGVILVKKKFKNL